jgi:biotin carboxylase
MPEKLAVVYDYGSVSPMRLAELANELDYSLVFVPSDSPHSRQMRPVLEYLGRVVGPADDYSASLLKALADERPTGIVTFSESRLSLTARLAKGLGLPFQHPDDIDALVTKSRQRDRLLACGVDSVRYRVVTEPADVPEALQYVGLPAVAKPLAGASSRNTVSIEDFAPGVRGIEALLREPDGDTAAERALIIEEQLVGRPTQSPWGDYVGIDLLSDGDGVHPLFVTGKFSLAPPFRERGGYAPALIDDAELREVIDLAKRAVRAMNIRHGASGVEIKFTQSGLRVIEVNGRLGGWVDDLAMRSMGFSPGELTVLSALGRSITPPPTGTGERIAYHYLVIPPVSARRVRSIVGPSQVRCAPGVDRVEVLAGVGSSTSWRLGTASSVAAVTGVVRTYRELTEVVERIEQARWIEYDSEPLHDRR